jgi:hypothetical protein
VEKGVFETTENFNIIRLFGSEEKPFLFSFYVSNKHFVVEVCKQYKSWDHFFNEKRKKQFILLPWKIREIIVKYISHLDELGGHLDQLDLNKVELVEGLDPNDMFTAHMSLIGYSSYFTRIEQFKEGGGDNLNILETSSDQAFNDLEELTSANEGYRKQSREAMDKNPNSLTVAQKSTSVRTKPRSSGLEMRKTDVGSSNDGSDKDPTKKNLEKTHIVYTFSKRKRDTKKIGLGVLETQERPWVMDVDKIIKEPSWFEQILLETQEIIESLVTREPKILEKEFLSLHHAAYNRASKKLLIEKVNTKK